VRPLHVESRVTSEPDAADAGGGAFGRHSSSRLVREPGRWPRLVAVAAALGLVAGAAALVVLGTGEPEEAGKRPAEARVAYLEAVRRLGYARSFAYRGSVHAAGPSALRPGQSIGTDVTVEGAVRLPQSITRDVAVDDRGRATETVTSGSTVWSRTAPSVERLARAAWDVAGPSDGLDVGSPDRLGAALLSDVLRAAGAGHRDGTDAAGRPVLRATVPPDDRDERYGDALDGADVRVTLDEAGDIAHVVLTSAEPKPRLVLRLDIVRLGDWGAISPDDVGNPARSTVAAEDLVAVGFEPLELGRLPPGWALTDARVSAGWPLMPSTPMQTATLTQAATCTSLGLDYRDLRAVSGGSLHLSTASQACVAVAGRVGTGSQGRPLRIGRFEGVVEERWGSTVGQLTDGTTRVSFTSDLPARELAALLASLRRFDSDRKPASRHQQDT
jgi:hypothetical protein